MNVCVKRDTRKKSGQQNHKWLLLFGSLAVLLILIIWLIVFLITNETIFVLDYCSGNGPVTVDSTEIVVSPHACEYSIRTVLDFKRLKKLKRLTIGAGNFLNVKALKLTGLTELESVEIGYGSFKYASLELRSGEAL